MPRLGKLTAIQGVERPLGERLPRPPRGVASRASARLAAITQSRVLAVTQQRLVIDREQGGLDEQPKDKRRDHESIVPMHLRCKSPRNGGTCHSSGHRRKDRVVAVDAYPGSRADGFRRKFLWSWVPE